MENLKRAFMEYLNGNYEPNVMNEEKDIKEEFLKIRIEKR